MSRTNQKKTPAAFIGGTAGVGGRKLMKTSSGNPRTRKARLQLVGACLLDSAYTWHIPASIHFSEYGAMTILLIQRGCGLEAITSHLEAVGIVDAHSLLRGALGAIPDGVELKLIFWNAVRVLAAGVAA